MVFVCSGEWVNSVNKELNSNASNTQYRKLRSQAKLERGEFKHGEKEILKVSTIFFSSFYVQNTSCTILYVIVYVPAKV